MNDVVVVIDGELRTYSLAEARELLLRLPPAIATAQGHSYMVPPVVNDGLLTRESMIRFFEQVYPIKHARSNVGRLLGRMIASANVPGDPSDPAYTGIPFVITHDKCGKHVREQRCSKPHIEGRPHDYAYTTPNRYTIDVASLKRHAADFLAEYAGKPAGKNLSLLLEYL